MRAKVIVFGLLALTILGCGGAVTNRGIAKLRALSAVTTPTSIDAFTDFDIVGTGLEVNNITSYTSQAANNLTVAVRESGQTGTLASASLAAEVDGKYTMIPYMTGLSTVGILLANDTIDLPAVSKGKFRFVHVDRLIGNVDVYYVDPTADLTEETPIFSNVPYQGITNYVELSAGIQKEIIVTNTGTVNQVGNTISITAPSQAVRTLLFLDKGGPSLHIYTDTP